ncbi:MAG: ATP-binding protein [Methyloligellaceae bacterium]
MARSRSARPDFFAYPAALDSPEIGRADVARFLPSEHVLRRIIPYLIALFVILVIVGGSTHFIYGKEMALAEARARAALIADTIAARFALASGKDADSWQQTLAESLPSGATLDNRRVLLADDGGVIRATAPLIGELIGLPILRILGTEQPVTTFGAQAGVQLVRLADGRKALVTVRNLGTPAAQLALLQPTDAALGAWWREVVFDTTIFATMGLLLVLFGRAFFWLSERSTRLEAEAAAFRHTIDHTMDAANSGLWDWNVARGHIRWSDSMLALLGRESQDNVIPFREVAKALHPDDDLYAAVERLVGGETDRFDESFRIRHQDGSWVRLRLKGILSRESEGNEPHLIALAAPADAAPVIAQSPDEKADARLRDAIETISEAFVLWDAENRLVICNSKYRQFHKLPEDIIEPGMAYEQVIAAACEPVVRTRITVADDDDCDAHTYEAQLEDGRWLHINERRTKDGGYVSVGTDITNLKTSQQRLFENEKELKATVADLRMSRRELEQQKQQLVDLAEKYALEKNRAEAGNRTKSEFLANISHELRTPLNAVIGFSEVMQNELFGPIGNDKYEEYAHDIHESGKYLLEVINDILDMSKIEAGRINLRVEPFDLDEIVEESLRVVTPAAEERGIQLERAGIESLEVQADKRALKQVLLNLLSNAVKFTPDRGTVTIKLTSEAKGRARIAITDTGVGIPQAELGKLGRPFEQVENQFSKSHKGSGLGLAISRSLIEMHGGHLDISSKEGEGTTVTCAIPVRPVLTGAGGLLGEDLLRGT